jgi:hypothetical protein
MQPIRAPAVWQCACHAKPAEPAMAVDRVREGQATVPCARPTPLVPSSPHWQWFTRMIKQSQCCEPAASVKQWLCSTTQPPLKRAALKAAALGGPRRSELWYHWRARLPCNPLPAIAIWTSGLAKFDQPEWAAVGRHSCSFMSSALSGTTSYTSPKRPSPRSSTSEWVLLSRTVCRWGLPLDLAVDTCCCTSSSRCRHQEGYRRNTCHRSMSR